MNNDFKKTVESIPFYIYHYGIWSGLKLSFRFLFHKTDSIRLKGIKERIFLRRKSSDIPTFHQVFAKREYDLKMLNIKAPRVIIDGGANIGLFSIFIKNKYPDSKIIAVEPDKENFEMMNKNLSNYENISLLNTGIWNKSTLLRVYDKFNKGKWGMVVEETDNNRDPTNIKSMSIPDIMKMYDIDIIDLLKLDIETSEKYLFDENCGSWLSKVKVIIIEIHDWIEPGCAQPFFSAINKIFDKYSYYISGEITIIVNESMM